MDTSATIWLALGTALVAAGASVLTVWLGHRYSMKRLHEERRQARDVWLRDFRMESYSNALRAHNQFSHAAALEEDFQPHLATLSSSHFSAELYAADGVYEQLGITYDAAMDLSTGLADFKSGKQPFPEDLFGKHSQHCRRLQTLMRGDIKLGLDPGYAWLQV